MVFPISMIKFYKSFAAKEKDNEESNPNPSSYPNNNTKEKVIKTKRKYTKRKTLRNYIHKLPNNLNSNASNKLSKTQSSGLQETQNLFKNNSSKKSENNLEEAEGSMKINNIESFDKNKISCNCKKSKCLKLYCDCFAAGEYCVNCNCVDCNNKIEYEADIVALKSQIVEKNPAAFQPKIDENINKHYKGCNCKNSGCQKKYCECFQNGIGCSESCKCRDCRNNKAFLK